MGQNKELTNQRLSQLWVSNEIDVLEVTGEKYAIMSDLHMGDGSPADDLRNNAETLDCALKHYKDNGFTLILLGDIEEFWQFSIEKIKKKYRDSIYSAFKSFGKNRFYRVFGNHDIDWSSEESLKKDEAKISKPVEALKMMIDDKPGILLFHGHQGSWEGDKRRWLSRIFIKYIWTPLEPIIRFFNIPGHPSATKSQVMKNYERVLYSWAKKAKAIVICGHSHRAIFSSTPHIKRLRDDICSLKADIHAHSPEKKQVEGNKKKINNLKKQIAEEKKRRRDIHPTEREGTPLPCYFNCGCALYTNGITTLEIENNIIRLVKWHKTPKNNKFFKVYNDGGGKTLSDFIQQIRK